MDLFALTPMQLAGGQIALAAILSIAGFALLLPQPRGRSISGGIAALVAALAVFGAWLHSAYGNPIPDLVGSVLFGLFSLGALGFGTVLVVQRNPARGAIAFAFVILSTCGLFLLLAAPFLMAATIIIYAGAIIVTFLFVLMLSHAQGSSNENDRSREPLFGSLAGFAFVGLVLFTLYVTHLGSAGQANASESAAPRAEQRLPTLVLTTEERKTLAEAIAKLDDADNVLSADLNLKKNKDHCLDYFTEIKSAISTVVGVSRKEEVTLIRDGTLRARLEKSPGKPGEEPILFREDVQARAILKRAAAIRQLNYVAYEELEKGLYATPPSATAAKASLHALREEVLLLYGSADLPARNVANLGYLLYTDHLLAVELAGTLLLVATIGAIAIAQRKGSAA